MSQDKLVSPAGLIEISTSINALCTYNYMSGYKQMNRLVPKIVKGRFFKVSWFGLAGVFSLSKSRVFRQQRYHKLAGRLNRIFNLNSEMTDKLSNLSNQTCSLSGLF